MRRRNSILPIKASLVAGCHKRSSSKATTAISGNYVSGIDCHKILCVCVPPCAAKTCAVRPVFAWVAGELWAACPSNCPRASAANASSGAQSEGAGWRWEPGTRCTKDQRTRTVSTCWSIQGVFPWKITGTKGVSPESSVTPKGTKHPQGYWAQQYIWHSKRHTQERRTFWQKEDLLKTSFLSLLLVPDNL